MAGRTPEHHIRLPFMRQAWRDVVFIHWPCPVQEITRHLPAGFTVDTYEGTAWVALSSFRVAACGIGPFPPLPAWAFPETNLRTYVKGPDGADGIWFIAIDADTLAVTLGARLGLGAPYHRAAMTVRNSGSSIRYESHRRRAPQVRHDIHIRPGPALEDHDRTPLVDWCTGRWRSWSTRAGLALSSPVQHQPWPLHHAELLALDETITTAAGITPPTDAPLVHYAPGVDARFSPPRPHRQPSTPAPPDGIG